MLLLALFLRTYYWWVFLSASVFVSHRPAGPEGREQSALRALLTNKACPPAAGFALPGITTLFKKGADRKRGLQILLEVTQNLSHFFFWRSLAQQARPACGQLPHSAKYGRAQYTSSHPHATPLAHASHGSQCTPPFDVLPGNSRS